MKRFFGIFLGIFTLFIFVHSVSAVQQSGGQIISVTIDNSAFELDAPVIDDIRNITTTSLDLIVEVEDKDGEDCDFVVRVKNLDTGETFTIDISETVGSDDTVTLSITGLDPGTEYEFKVKYALDGSDDESDYSDSKTAITESEDVDYRQVLICYEGNNISINEFELDSYLEQGATVGNCKKSGDVEICYNGETLSVVQSTVQGYINRGGTIGACLDDGGVISGGSIDAPISGSFYENMKEGIRKIIIPEEAEAFYKSLAGIGAITGALGALASSSVPLFAAMPGSFSNTIFLRLLELLGIIGKRKEEHKWGVVFDGETKIPIQAAKIILSDSFNKELATTYSDRMGRFGFLAAPGKYKINVFKKDYKLITSMLESDVYGNVYNGGEVEVGEDNVISTNIAMRVQGLDWNEYSQKKIRQYNSGWSKFKKHFFSGMYFIGFFATVIITYFYPSTLNFFILGVYILIFVYQTFFKKNKYGIIKTDKGDPVAFAVVSLHDAESEEKRAFAVTDPIGRYYLLADNGGYKIKAKGQPIGSGYFEKQGSVEVRDGIVREEIIV